ncbi:MAG: FecCD family ABC transporter permease [Fervidicoccaceae archaeon]
MLPSIRRYLEIKRRKLRFVFLLSIAVIFPVSLLSIYLGSSGTLPIERWNQGDPIFLLRAYRTITGILAASSLSLNGLLLQTILMNPIVDSSILGISSGAMLGTLLGYIASIKLGLYVVPAFSFLFSLAVTTAIYVLSRIGGFKILVITLGGVMISTMLTSISYMILIVNPTISRGGVAIVLGSLQFSNSTTVYYGLFSLISIMVYLLLRIGKLRKLMLGEDIARSEGIKVEEIRKESILASSISIAFVTLAVGPIGFIGLIVPHISRILVGGDPGASAVVSASLAPSLLLLADIASRIAFMPSELPVGIAMSMLGAPYFLFLLLRSVRRGER